MRQIFPSRSACAAAGADRFAPIRCCFLPFLLIFCVSFSSAAPAAGKPMPSRYTRWAIVGAGDAAALRDLAYAELTPQPGIELVDRDELRKVTDELLLANSLSPEGAASRLRLGALLNADAVIVLKLLGEGDERTLRVVVVDCRMGTRLRLETLPWKAANLPALAAHLRDLACALRLQYAAGIGRIVGVPNFVSRSFSHDYDPLQEQYGELLLQVLMLEPGVAVIETAEVQAIGREMAINGQQRLARMVPLLVQGDFRVETPADAPPTVSLTVKLTDRTGVIGTADSGPLGLDQAPKWITTALPVKVIAGGVNAKPLSVDEQAQALAARGEAFAALGSYDQSIPLRECAILLNPNNPPVRVALIDEYLKRYYDEYARTRTRLMKKYNADRLNTYPQAMQDPEMDAALAAISEGYIAALDHAEYLIRHQQLSRSAANGVLEKLRQFSARLNWLAQEGEKPVRERPAGLAHLAEAEKARQRFLLAVIPPVMRKIDAGKAAQSAEDSVLITLRGTLCDLACQNLARGRLNLSTLAFIRQAAELMPDDFLPLSLPNLYYRKEVFAPEVTEDAYLKFLESARESPHRLVRADAAGIPLYRRFRQAEAAGNRAELLAVQAEAQTLADALTAIPNSYSVVFSRADATLYFRQDLKKAIAKLEQGTAPAATTQDTGALRFDKYALQQPIPPMPNVITPPTEPFTWFQGMHVIPCGKFDIVWRDIRGLYFHRTAGLLEPAALPETQGPVCFNDVVWDGRYAWISTDSRGLWVVNADGKLIKQIAQPDGLPPGERTVRLYPAAPGRILAVGSIGKDRRAWCAMITLTEPAAASVKVFHEGIQVPTAADDANRRAFMRNPNASFTPQHIARVAGVRPGEDTVVAVIRELDLPGYGWRLDPLAINLNTLQVGIWEPGLKLPAGIYFRPDLITAQGTVLGYDNTTQTMLRLSAVKTANGPELFPIPVTNPGPTDPASTNRYDREHVEHLYPPDTPATVLPAADGRLYVAGEEWWRIDPEMLTAQRLTRGKLPEQYSLRMEFGYSSLLGLIAWNNDGLYRITIDETKIPKKGE